MVYPITVGGQMKLSRDELVMYKVRLEHEIAAKVSEAVEQFKRQTGFTVNRINISLVEVTGFGQHPNHIVAKADVDIRV